jgi:hypothetical protein
VFDLEVALEVLDLTILEYRQKSIGLLKISQLCLPDIERSQALKFLLQDLREVPNSKHIPTAQVQMANARIRYILHLLEIITESHKLESPLPSILRKITVE